MGIDYSNEVSNCECDMYEVGSNYYIRTVTYHFVGELIAKYSKGSVSELIFKKCSWIAESGRYADALKKGEFEEVEPYPPNVKVSINRTAIVDGSEWLHDLPTKQK